VAGVIPSLASVAPVGAILLLARRPLGKLCLHRPAPVFHGVASRLLAQPALQTEPVFSC
jgi:hypothetical protein